MFVSVEYASDGITLLSRVEDNGDGTGNFTTFNEDGSIQTVENLTDLPVFSYPPLDATGALTTLLVVLNVITLEEGSNVIHEEPEHLIAEAEAWSLGS